MQLTTGDTNSGVVDNNQTVNINMTTPIETTIFDTTTAGSVNVDDLVEHDAFLPVAIGVGVCLCLLASMVCVIGIRVRFESGI